MRDVRCVYVEEVKWLYCYGRANPYLLYFGATTFAPSPGSSLPFRSTDADDDKRAGPPFQAPYTLSLPDWDSDKWRVHRDLINGSADLITEIEKNAAEEHRLDLRALRDHDELTLHVVERLMAAEMAREETEENDA